MGETTALTRLVAVGAGCGTVDGRDGSELATIGVLCASPHAVSFCCWWSGLASRRHWGRAWARGQPIAGRAGSTGVADANGETACRQHICELRAGGTELMD